MIRMQQFRQKKVMYIEYWPNVTEYFTKTEFMYVKTHLYSIHINSVVNLRFALTGHVNIPMNALGLHNHG